MNSIWVEVYWRPIRGALSMRVVKWSKLIGDMGAKMNGAKPTYIAWMAEQMRLSASVIVWKIPNNIHSESIPSRLRSNQIESNCKSYMNWRCGEVRMYLRLWKLFFYGITNNRSLHDLEMQSPMEAVSRWCLTRELCFCFWNIKKKIRMANPRPSTTRFEWKL